MLLEVHRQRRCAWLTISISKYKYKYTYTNKCKYAYTNKCKYAYTYKHKYKASLSVSIRISIRHRCAWLTVASDHVTGWL